ncbi:MAG TPA: hypothetical protein PK490_04880 [Prosthecobacter sp.]|nr:hypothetical protein [Prosthecobacter sp.]HRK13597.1 hypothetical protein [Prosthecobacter sp.]
MKPALPKSALAALALALSTIHPVRAGVLEDWLKLLPPSTIAVISVKDSPELMADWEKSGIGRMMQDEAFKRWTAPMMKDGEAPWDTFARENFGESLHDNLARYPGASLAAFVADSPQQIEEQDGVPAFIAFSETGDKRKELEESMTREKELALAKEDGVKARTEEIAGEQVEILAKSEEPGALWESGHAFVGGVLVESNSAALMEQMILALKNGAAENPEAILGHIGRIEALHGGSPDALVYFNGEVLMQWAVTAAREFGATAAKGSPLPVTPDQVIEALGLQELQSLALMMNLEDGQSVFDLAVLHASKPAGLLSLVRGGAGAVELPGFVPGDVVSASAMRMSLLELWDKLLAIVQKMGPAAALLTGQLGIYEQQFGVKIRDDLFASLDDQYYEITDAADGVTSQVIAIKIKDGKRFGGAVEAVKKIVGAGFGAFDETEYLGHTIQSVKTAGATAGSPGFAFCVTDTHLLMSTGPVALLQDVLARMRDPSGPSLWEDARAKDLMSRLSPGYNGVGVTDGARIMKLLVDTIVMARSGLGGSTKAKGPKGGAAKSAEDAVDGIFDPDAAPSEETWSRYFGTSVTGTYQPDDAIHVRFLTTPVEAR